MLTRALWGICGLLTMAMVAGVARDPIALGPFRIDGLSVLLGAAVTLVSATVHSFARRYMEGDAGYDRFLRRLAVLTGTVLVVLSADHMLVLLVAWAAMGWLLADLIAHVRGWPQAREAARLARRWFAVGSAALALGLIGLAGQTGTMSLSAALGTVAQVEAPLRAAIGSCLAIAAIIQCGLLPAHRWLMSSMTAPTPVSAFMHAGLVNAGGILLARTAPIYEGQAALLLGIFVVGAASALLGAVVALTQPDVKRGLAASTVAQMGFMVLQCGLGFHAAAMAHLILHGLYKAALFLGSGSALANAKAPHAQRDQAPARSTIVVAAAGLSGFAAALAFAWASGKGLSATSGLVLIVFAGLAAAQAVGGMARGFGPRPIPLLVLGPLGLGAVGAVYGLLVRLTETALRGVPGLSDPQPLSVVHGLVIAAFLVVWGWILLGRHRTSPRAYAVMLHLGQPAMTSVTADRRAYRAG